MDRPTELRRYPPSLTDDLLYVVVFGPGYGESIVLRIPPATWVVVDALTIEGDDQIPMRELLRNHGASWSAVALTHPHDDHASGLPALLEEAQQGLVACVAPYVEPPEQWIDSDDAAHQLSRGRVEAALAAIQYQWERRPESRWELVSGNGRTLGDAQITCFIP